MKSAIQQMEDWLDRNAKENKEIVCNSLENMKKLRSIFTLTIPSEKQFTVLTTYLQMLGYYLSVKKIQNMNFENIDMAESNTYEFIVSVLKEEKEVKTQ